MRVAIVYPPLTRNGHFALLGQNRQFKFSASNSVRIFPLVPASAATLLKNVGHDVCFLDGINERLSETAFWARLQGFRPELVVMETKAPVVHLHCRIAREIRSRIDTKVALVGDHITALPEESLLESAVDFCITGGDYDATIRDLASYLSGSGSMPLGVYFRSDGLGLNSGAFELVGNLDELPFIDRCLTKWWLYGEAYLYHPVAYILTGRGCGIAPTRAGTCTFCIWQHTLWRRTARLRSPENVVREIQELVDKYRVKEVFDDNEAGPFWDRQWLKDFAREMVRAGLPDRVRLSSNARADALDDEVCRLMKAAGYRLLKVGLESGCDATLKRLSKQESKIRIAQGVRAAKDFGLAVLLTTMVGYPWETEEEVTETYRFARDLILYKTRLGDSLQASIVVPYPGTPLYRQAEREGWLEVASGDYEKYDMSTPVLKTSIDAPHWCRRMWRIHYESAYLLKTLVSIRSIEDIALLGRGVTSLVGHLRDYRRGEAN